MSTPTTRPIRADELLLPGQAVILIVEGEAAAIWRIGTVLRDKAALALQRWAPSETHPGRVGYLFRAVLGLEAPTLVRWITEAAGPSPVRFSLSTTDIGALAEESLDEVLDVAIEVVTFVPRTAGRFVGRYLQTGPGMLLVALGLAGLVGVAVVVARR